MIHKLDGQVFGCIYIFLLLLQPREGQSQETDLSQTVKAMLGDDVVLPCQVKPPEDPTQTTVEWGRPDLKPRFVFVLHNQKEYMADQNKVYRGRTSLFHDKLKNGNVSLKLSNVRHSDNGKYRCYNPKEKTESFVDLLVGTISSPHISLSGLDKSSSGVMLDCNSAGWYPEPEILWLDGEEHIMSAGSAEKIRGPDGLYSVSSRVTVEKRHNNNITCRLTQKDINQTRETYIYVPDGFFVAQPDCSVCISFNIILAIMLVFGAIFLIWMKRKSKNTKKKISDKYNKENEELLTKVKNSNTEKEIQKSYEEQRSIDQQIQALIEMSKDLEEQKKQLADQKREAEKMVEGNERKLTEVDEDIRKEKTIEKKAQGYLILKGIITTNNQDLLDRMKGHQNVELMTDKLMNKTQEEVTKLNERKMEIENHIMKLKN